VTPDLKATPFGTDVNILQENLPDIIAAAQCYLGWQEALRNGARLVAQEIRCWPVCPGDFPGTSIRPSEANQFSATHLVPTQSGGFRIFLTLLNLGGNWESVRRWRFPRWQPQ
jgi:hypothetical protein